MRAAPMTGSQTQDTSYERRREHLRSAVGEPAGRKQAPGARVTQRVRLSSRRMRSLIGGWLANTEPARFSKLLMGFVM